MELTDMKCEACQVGAPPATSTEIAQFLQDHTDWALIEHDTANRLQRTFSFTSYKDSLDFTIKVGELAEVEDHHPDVLLQWGRVTVTWWTHKINALHKNDLIMAAKTEALYA